jgi:hypothetical protein
MWEAVRPGRARSVKDIVAVGLVAAALAAMRLAQRLRSK